MSKYLCGTTRPPPWVTVRAKNDRRPVRARHNAPALNDLHPALCALPSAINAVQALSESFDFAGGVTFSGSDNQPATCESFALFASKQRRKTQGGRAEGVLKGRNLYNPQREPKVSTQVLVWFGLVFFQQFRSWLGEFRSWLAK